MRLDACVDLLADLRRFRHRDDQASAKRKARDGSHQAPQHVHGSPPLEREFSVAPSTRSSAARGAPSLSASCSVLSTSLGTSASLNRWRAVWRWVITAVTSPRA